MMIYRYFAAPIEVQNFEKSSNMPKKIAKNEEKHFSSFFCLSLVQLAFQTHFSVKKTKPQVLLWVGSLFNRYVVH